MGHVPILNPQYPEHAAQLCYRDADVALNSTELVDESLALGCPVATATATAPAASARCESRGVSMWILINRTDHGSPLRGDKWVIRARLP